MEVKPVVLHGAHVRLEPMLEAHIPALASIGVGKDFWDFMLYGRMDSVEDMRGWVQDILRRAETGTDVPFVAMHLATGRLAGATRYLNIVPHDRGLEIGGTWYGLEFQPLTLGGSQRHWTTRRGSKTPGSECSFTGVFTRFPPWMHG